MIRTSLVAVLCLAAASAVAAPAPRKMDENSHDVRRQRMLDARTATKAATSSTPEVGDIDSFGRAAKYLGLVQVTVALQSDCTTDPLNPPPPNERCVVVNPAPEATNFSERDLAVIRLPARSTNSLLCHTLTPGLSFGFYNGTGADQYGYVSARALITVESEVLNDPTILNPSTGQPYGGKLETSLSTYHEDKMLAPNAYESKTMFLTRHCIGGFLSKQALVQGYGLTEAQAAELFRKPITLRFGASGSTQMTEYLHYLYGMRIYGD